MDRVQILETLKQIVREKLNYKGDLEEKTEFLKDLNADSLDLLSIVMAVEDTFGIKIPDEDLPQLRTVGDALEYVLKKKA
ncbi:MAG: acyl carrier protein [Coprothermobacterota bacterium]|jgi:acyl carrier protein|nr:acyl carrier protein [Caldisericota bacterium]MDI6869235.1 acyl carrier protein [Coprothermobacterota bacterium]